MKLSTKNIEKILRAMPKIKMEVECKSWGCCTPHYKEVVEPSSVMYHINQYLKKKKNAQTKKS